MEKISFSNKTQKYYGSNTKDNCWFIIFSYLELPNILNLEKVSKFFRRVVIQYYLENNKLLEESKNSKPNDNSKKHLIIPDLFFDGIKNYKKKIISENINFLFQIPYTLVEFCGSLSNKNFISLIEEEIIKINDFDCIINLNQIGFLNIQFMRNNKFIMIINNYLIIFKLNQNNKFYKEFSFPFDKKIIFCDCIQNSIFLIDSYGYLIIMNSFNYSCNIKKVKFCTKEDIKKVFFIQDSFFLLILLFFLFLL